MPSRGPMLIIAAFCLIAGPIILSKLDPSLLGGSDETPETASNPFSDIPAYVPAAATSEQAAAAPTTERRTMNGGGALFVTARQ